MQRTNSVLGIFFLMLAVACDTEIIQPDDKFTGANFFPLETGDYRIYDVEEIEYIFAGDNDTVNYQLKEVVTDSFKNLEDRISYILKRYTKKEGQEWEIDSVWQARKNSNQAIMVEGNTPIIKLVFPLEENKTWDGNALNAYESDDYFMQDVFSPFFTDDSVKYEHSLTVVQEKEDDNILFERLRTEVYAENIGMIYKENRNLTFCADEGCIGLKEIESGKQVKMNMIEYGNE